MPPRPLQIIGLVVCIVVWVVIMFWLRKGRPPRRVQISTPAPAPPRPITTTQQVWMRDFAAYYRALGFFEDYDGKTDEEVAAELLTRYDREWGEPFQPDPDGQDHDLPLIRLDTRRVWWRDLEAGVYPGAETYQDILRELAATSRGAFAPVDVKETWTASDQPPLVTFTVNGQHYSFRPMSADEWIDPSIIDLVNEVIKDTPYQFAMYDSTDQAVTLVALTTEERTRLIKERGWRFWK